MRIIAFLCVVAASLSADAHQLQTISTKIQLTPELITVNARVGSTDAILLAPTADLDGDGVA